MKRARNKNGLALLSSGRRFGLAALALLSVAAAGATLAWQVPDAPAPSAPAAIVSPAPAGVPPRTDPLWPAIDNWNRLRRSDGLAFEDYANFLIAHPGWPGEPALRRAAERAIAPDATDPALVARFLTLFAPTTAAGRVRLAEALAATGRTEEARDAAARAWTAGAMAAEDEGRLLARFAGQFTPAEQDQRMERLLWDRSTASALRQLPLASPARQPLYTIRIAFQTRSTDAGGRAAALGAEAERDPGFVIDRALWLRDTAQGAAARAYLGQARTFDVAPLDPEKYLEALLANARAAAADNQSTIAYDIAARADAAVPAGANLRMAALSLRDDYTSLVWLGGWTALKKLNRPRDAEGMFARYAAAAQTPGSQAKGEYWAGRAAQAAGDQALASTHFTNAATNIDQFYGQLASERLGRSIAAPPAPAAPEITETVRSDFTGREVVRAARLLGEQRQWQDQTQFVRKIAADAQSDSDHALAGELAASLARPDLGVMVSRTARTGGARDPIRIGFPTVSIPPTMQSHWTMMHAIARQESQFDREALSPTGARGLVQLMPATAREQAGKLGIPYQPDRLTSDIGYNVMIGSSFFDRVLTYYQGNYVLAVAAYNAGQGNVNKFIRTNGDPRVPGTDVIDWIEAIPFSETRSYVQKVLENAVVYDLFNPARARTPEKDRLSFYLGKKDAG